MILYYVEEKAYYTDAQGFDRQLPDGGQLPTLYHTADKAIRRANRMIDLRIDTYGLQVTIDNEHYPSKGEDILFATRLEDPLQGTRFEIRVYEIVTLH